MYGHDNPAMILAVLQISMILLWEYIETKGFNIYMDDMFWNSLSDIAGFSVLFTQRYEHLYSFDYVCSTLQYKRNKSK